MCSSQERKQNLAPNPVQPLSQDKRQTRRHQQYSGTFHPTQGVQRACYLHGSRRYSSARRRQQEAVHSGRGRVNGRPSFALCCHSEGATAPARDYTGAQLHGQRAPDHVLQEYGRLQATPFDHVP
uniref:Uncharacterized protein n=1 Tax=Cacopsylla melanoneura TaxID=428564 RepID=A0A8D8WZB0_9HEMI